MNEKSSNPLIHVLNKRLALHQMEGGFRTSTDSVLLAAACPAKAGEHILDLGCGVGSAGLCVLTRVEGTKLTGIDLQEDHVALARENAALNAMQSRSDFLQGDVREITDLGLYHHVICNPPYKEAGAHIPARSEKKARAMGHTETNLTLQSWITCAWNHIKGQGSLTLIHEAGQVDTILHNLYSPAGGRRYGAVDVIPIYPKAGKPAKRVIIRAYKHRKAPTTLHPGLIMHTENGDYTAAADQILRQAKAVL